MRQIDVLAGMMALVAMGVGAQQAGCVFNYFEDCDTYPHAGCPGVGTTGTGTGGHMSSSTGTATGGTGGSPVVCNGDPSPVVMGMGNIQDECAVFVRSDATGTTPDGTMANPYATLQEALDKPKGNRTKVFACAPMTKPFKEAVTLSAGLEVYGGFDCGKAMWTWTASGRTELDGLADKVALTVNKAAGGALVSGFAIKAAAPSLAMGGGSSIAVAVDDLTSNATLKRSDISAEAGADGASGTTPTDAVTAGADAPMPVHNQMDACSNPASLIGGAPGATTCGTSATSGGLGGKGGTDVVNAVGSKGGDGSQLPSPNPTMAGVGGVGQTDLVDMSKTCHDGAKGLAGGNGINGAAGTALGTLSLAGINGGNGGDGGAGAPGQGGGGGGGAEFGVFCPGNVGGVGASGGGAGAGGCGGKGGLGGAVGGSSIAILTLGTKLTVDGSTVTLTTKKGGAGGNGAAGQSGGSGGNGAKGGATSGMSPSIDGCKGGDGGKGGVGGPGGGGRGGFSAGVAFAKAPTAKPTFKMPPTVGAPGTPGASTGNPGAAGSAGAVCDFSKASNPCM